jgi:hypothetical protein
MYLTSQIIIPFLNYNNYNLLGIPSSGNLRLFAKIIHYSFRLLIF